ncbi:MAG: hypothetical protein Q8O67_32800 [Deltaproteobacteria bacterium]|nr:hypothetical protein [Deltaproteobacteria bacterium]
MRPPICAICHVRFHEEGGLVSFALDDAARAFAARRASKPGFVGHPPQKEWFCAAHIEAARALTHLTRGDALTQLRALAQPGSPGAPPEKE